jgi:uncharacterized membrane protein (GlpM family)
MDSNVPPQAVPAAAATPKAGYKQSLIAAAVVLCVVSLKGAGFLLGMLVPFFLLWTLYSLIRMAIRPAERRIRAVRFAIWLATFALIGAMQAYWNKSARDDGDIAVAAVQAHQSRTGAYPATLAEAGLGAPETLWGVRYQLRDGKPFLGYPSTLIWLTRLEYDFDNRQWRENSY